MNTERAILAPQFPSPDAGAPCPVTVADDLNLFIQYVAQSGKVIVVHFPLCSIFSFGSPNDEALNGHPLHSRGLKPYSVHIVQDSSWIDLLERRNSVHPRHDRKRFLEDKRHYIFTFHDSTLECVVDEGRFWLPKVQEFESEELAQEYIRNRK